MVDTNKAMILQTFFKITKCVGDYYFFSTFEKDISVIILCLKV